MFAHETRDFLEAKMRLQLANEADSSQSEGAPRFPTGQTSFRAADPNKQSRSDRLKFDID